MQMQEMEAACQQSISRTTNQTESSSIAQVRACRVKQKGGAWKYRKHAGPIGDGRWKGQRQSSSTSQAGMRLHLPRHVPARCTSRDHESDKCPKNQEPRKLHGASLELHRLVYGFRCDVQHNSRDFRLREPCPWCVVVGLWSNRQCWKRVSDRSDS